MWDGGGERCRYAVVGGWGVVGGRGKTKGSVVEVLWWSQRHDWLNFDWRCATYLLNLNT